jgi:CheY-like chemotaxis protein
MPGKRGLEVFRDVRELAPTLPVVMVTKSEKTRRSRRPSDHIRDYLVKPINPRRSVDGSNAHSGRAADSPTGNRAKLRRDSAPSSWARQESRLARLDRPLRRADALGCRSRRSGDGTLRILQGLYPDMHREFAAYIKEHYPAWLRDLNGNRPPLSIDVVGEFLLPILERDGRPCLSSSIACGSISGALGRCSPTSTSRRRTTAITTDGDAVLAQRVVPGLFPGEIAARLPDWWGQRRSRGRIAQC